MIKFVEWTGVLLAMIASLFVAANNGQQGLGYIIYLMSCFLVGYVCIKRQCTGLFVLQLYFIAINTFGVWNYLLR